MRGEGPEREEEELSMEAREYRYLAQWLETNKMQFNKVLYLEREKISIQGQDWGNLLQQ